MTVLSFPWNHVDFLMLLVKKWMMIVHGDLEEMLRVDNGLCEILWDTVFCGNPTTHSISYGVVQPP